MHMFVSKGLDYPPVMHRSFESLCEEICATPRECERIAYYDIVDPIGDIHTEEIVMDVSQNLGRLPLSDRSTGCLPCIIPGGRYYLRRQQRFMFASEVLRAQGWGPTEACGKFTERQLIDIAGNGFHSSSLSKAKLSAYVTAGRLIDLGLFP